MLVKLIKSGFDADGKIVMTEGITHNIYSTKSKITKIWV